VTKTASDDLSSLCLIQLGKEVKGAKYEWPNFIEFHVCDVVQL